MILRHDLIFFVTFFNNSFVVILGITSKLNTFPTRYELFQLLNDIRHKWYEIGLSLQISRNVLDDLKHSGGNDELLPVIDNFLITQPSPVSWETVITAVESSIVNDKKTGDLIRRYLTTCKSNKLL